MIEGLSESETYHRRRGSEGNPKHQVLWQEGTAPEEIGSFQDLLNNTELRRDAEIDLYERYGDLWEDIQSRCDSDKERDERREKTINLLIWYNWGSRLANEWLIRITHTKSDNELDFGNFVRNALKDPENFDHGDPHARIIDAVQKAEMIILGPDIYDETGLMPVAAAMKAIPHDLLQLTMQQEKRMNPDDVDLAKVNPKDDHQFAAATFIVLLKDEIKNRGHLSNNLANQLVAVLAADISVHDATSDFQSRLSDNDKVSAVGLLKEELYRRAKDGSLDLLSLSCADWFSILQRRQFDASQKRGFNPVVYGKYGLGDKIEHHFSKQIRQGLNNHARLSFSDSANINRQLVIDWASLFNLADRYEMYAPGNYAAVRKEQVFVSRSRPLTNVQKDSEGATSDDNKLNNASSWSRAMYEFWSTAKFLSQSPFFENELFRDYMTNSILFNLLEAESLYEMLANGENGLFVLDNIASERIRAVGSKAVEKSGGKRTVADQLWRQSKDKNVDEVIRYTTKSLLAAFPHEKYASRFAKRAWAILKSIEAVKNNIRNKPYPDETPSHGIPYVLTDDENRQLRLNFNDVWRQICDMLDIDRINQRDIRTQMMTRKETEISAEYPMLPNPVYDSLGAMGDAKTLTELSFEIIQQLKKINGEI